MRLLSDEVKLSFSSVVLILNARARPFAPSLGAKLRLDTRGRQTRRRFSVAAEIDS